MPHRRPMAPGSFQDRLDSLIEQVMHSPRSGAQSADPRSIRKRKSRKASARTINQVLFDAAKR
jgi:hypothetical protein